MITGAKFWIRADVRNTDSMPGPIQVLVIDNPVGDGDVVDEEHHGWTLGC